MNDQVLSAALAAILSPLLVKCISWLFSRYTKHEDDDRAACNAEIKALWAELESVKAEQSQLKIMIAQMPTRSDFFRLEEKIDRRIDKVHDALLTAIKEFKQANKANS